MLAILLDDVTR